MSTPQEILQEYIDGLEDALDFDLTQLERLEIKRRQLTFISARRYLDILFIKLYSNSKVLTATEVEVIDIDKRIKALRNRKYLIKKKKRAMNLKR